MQIHIFIILKKTILRYSHEECHTNVSELYVERCGYNQNGTHTSIQTSYRTYVIPKNDEDNNKFAVIDKEEIPYFDNRRKLVFLCQ